MRWTWAASPSAGIFRKRSNDGQWNWILWLGSWNNRKCVQIVYKHEWCFVWHPVFVCAECEVCMNFCRILQINILFNIHKMFGKYFHRSWISLLFLFIFSLPMGVIFTLYYGASVWEHIYAQNKRKTYLFIFTPHSLSSVFDMVKFLLHISRNQWGFHQ